VNQQFYLLYLIVAILKANHMAIVLYIMMKREGEGGKK